MNVRRTRQPVLPIGSLPRVDLLPPSEMRRRDMLARARAWMVVGIAAVAVSALLVGGAAAYHVASSVRLGLEQEHVDIWVRLSEVVRRACTGYTTADHGYPVDRHGGMFTQCRPPRKHVHRPPTAPVSWRATWWP